MKILCCIGLVCSALVCSALVGSPLVGCFSSGALRPPSAANRAPGPLASVVLMPLTERSHVGVLGHAVGPDARPVAGLQVLSSDWQQSTTTQHVQLLREVSGEGVMAGGTNALALELGARGVTHVRYDVVITGYTTLSPGTEQYQSRSRCCDEQGVLPHCAGGYVQRMLRGSGTVEYLHETSGEVAVGEDGAAGAQVDAGYVELHRSEFEDVYFGFEPAPLDGLCVALDPEQLVEPIVVRPAPNCRALSVDGEGTVRHMPARWLPGGPTCVKVIENYCQTRVPQVSCRGSFLQPDGQIRTVDPRGELVMEASGVSVEASALPDSCLPVAD